MQNENQEENEIKTEASSVIYSPDVVIDEFNLDTMLGHTLASLCVGPMRIVTRIGSNLALLSPIHLTKCIRNMMFVALFLFLFSLIQSFFIKSYFFPITSFCILLLLSIWYKRTAFQKKKEQLEKEFHIDSESIESVCNEIYTILDKIMKEEFK